MPGTSPDKRGRTVSDTAPVLSKPMVSITPETQPHSAPEDLWHTPVFYNTSPILLKLV